MKCFNCNEEMNPTLLYCNHCGVPMDNEPEDIIADAEDRAREQRLFQAVAEARGVLVLTLFLLGCSVALRFVVLKDHAYDHFPAYRAPYSLVEDAAINPPVALDVEPEQIPIPND